MITLQNGRVRLKLAPEAGGGVARLAVDGRDILRPAPPGSSDPLEMACFPLVPFANRVAHGAFRFGGRDIRLPREDDGHALHGQGWRTVWTVDEHGPDEVTLGFRHAPGDWPWAYSAEQCFTLLESGLRIGLTLRNDGTKAMPFSLGFHPYFLRAPSTTLDTSTNGIWSDASVSATPPAFAGAPLGISDLSETDHCHSSWNRRAMIAEAEQHTFTELTADDGLSFLQVYAPPGEAFFCAEPVSAVPDAFNRTEPWDITGMRALRPGESATVWMEIRLLQR